jgi:hypothetical protein
VNKNILTFLFLLGFLLFLTGCNTAAQRLAESTGNKNIGIDGYLLYGTVDTADDANNTPVGKLLMGRVSYKSRKVGIPADQKVPFTGNFKSTRNKTLFGTEEHIIEYDFTAGSQAEADAAVKQLELMKQESLAEKK